MTLPAEERLEGTIATTVMAVMKGAAFVRVHDVKENIRADSYDGGRDSSKIIMHGGCGYDG